MSHTIAISSKPGLYEKLIIHLLSNMKLGRLHLFLPDSSQITIGEGNGQEAEIRVKHKDFFKRCVLYGDIGFGESYVDGLWETNNITSLIKWFLLNVENAPTVSGSRAKSVLTNLLKFFNRFSHLGRANNQDGSRKNIAEHYDLSNDFFSLFLDPSMTYSSAYFKNENMTLEEAQLAKYERLCQQLRIKPGDHVLEIGCGWGSNAVYIAKNYGCKVTSLTISKEQYEHARERVKREKLENRITICLQDYRQITGNFDKIVSIEMLEAVGAEYYDTYFKKCSDLLTKNGLLALQVITCPDSRFESLKNGVDWIQKHIFPGSLLPSVAAINKSVNNVSDLTLVDLKDIGLHYAHTLCIWHKEFNKRLGEVKQLGFDDKFIRKWNYYLCYCEAAFAMRNIYVMQMVYSRPNNNLI